MMNKLQIQLPPDGPNVIGATVGSGTRVVVGIVRRAGMYVGTEFNKADDAISFRDCYNRWSANLIEHRNSGLPPEIEAQMIRELQTALEAHLEGFGSEQKQPWGWKNPMSMYVLPFFHAMFPEIKFVHVVRDGRDMAYSQNQGHLSTNGSLFLSTAERETWSQPVQSIALWNRANLLVAEYGEKKMPGQYLRIRFEDLCYSSVATVSQILQFFGLEGDAEQIASEAVSPPDSIGRWRNQEPETLKMLHQIGRVGLQKFGYAMGDQFRGESEPRMAEGSSTKVESKSDLSTSRLQEIQGNLQKSRLRLAQIQARLKKS